MYVQDTIAAISTPLGEGGIGIVRVSGSKVGEIAARLFRGKWNGGFESHRFYYGELVDPADSRPVDEVLLVLMFAPRSYTREDVLEIHSHGGWVVVQKVLELVVREGARLADPGEFTRRAFLNGRIDLMQAEAVIDVIRSKTDAALAMSQHQRDGVLSRRISAIRDKVVECLALVEAYVDFPEDEVGGEETALMDGLVAEAQGEIAALLAGFEEGRVLREGVSLLIVGKPNVGKSSLLNTLLREKRVIVTAIPGTTRDIVEEVVNIRGLPVKVLDTAGIRETEDVVEKEGVRLTLERIPVADLILFLLDGGREFDGDDARILAALAERQVLVVVNKSDIPRRLTLPAAMGGGMCVEISTLTGEGMEGLRDAIFSRFMRGDVLEKRDFSAISHTRHRDVLERAGASLQAFAGDMSTGVPPDLLAVHLREALGAIGEVTGETTPDEVLERIFQRFCVGK